MALLKILSSAYGTSNVHCKPKLFAIYKHITEERKRKK